MRKIFIHVGAHKTASTYIQKWCTENPETLTELGLVYPRFGHQLFGHHGIASIFAQSKDIAASRAAFQEEIGRTSGNIIISSENLEYLNDSELCAMNSFCAGFDVTVVYFYRNWTPLLYSMWQEEIKHGRFPLYQEYCLEHVVFPYSSRVLNFGAVIKRLCDAFGKDRVRIANFESVVAKGDILRFFLELCGITYDFPIKSGLVNQSFDPFTVEAIRALNHLKALMGERPDFNVKHNFINRALVGDGGKRFARLRAIMEPHRLSLRDFSKAAISRIFFADFLRQFGELMCDDPEARFRCVNAPVDPGFVIRPDYLLDPEAVVLLNSFIPDL